MTERLIDYAMENPDLCRVWLQQVLASPNPTEDVFWREYVSRFAQFAALPVAESCSK